jgi:hypothetical protein
MEPSIRTGRFVGTGAAVNISLGFIPDVVFTWKITDLDKVNIWQRGSHMLFTSGGTREIVPGDVIQGATNTGVRARVLEVYLTSGTWAGGDAAGHFIIEDATGNFGSENVDLLNVGGIGIRTANVATVAVQSELANMSVVAATAGVTPAQGIQPYAGSAATAAQGFTVTATLSEAAHVFGYLAIRNGSELG